MRPTRTIDVSQNDIESAKNAALALTGSDFRLNDILNSESLEEIESGIRKLNEMSTNCWLLSSILLYTLIFNHSLYEQSGLDWFHYSKQARERLGIDNHDITEQLGAARFFIKYHRELIAEGFTLKKNNRKLSRAETALKLSGSAEETIKHISHDTWIDFRSWYMSFKGKKAKTENGKFYIGDIEAVTISEKLPVEEAAKLRKYLKAYFDNK